LQYFRAVALVINLIVLFLFIYAFLVAEAKPRIILTVIIALLFILPLLFKIPAVYWICYAGKVVFGIFCYVFTKTKGFSL